MGSDYAPIEYEFSNEYVVLDPFTCDLNLAVDKECLLAYPLSGEGFSSMWAGSRATYGTYDTKTVFEVHASIKFHKDYSSKFLKIYYLSTNSLKIIAIIHLFLKMIQIHICFELVGL